MFLLQELPNRKTLLRFSKKYPEMDLLSMEACLPLLKLASQIMKHLEAHFADSQLSLARFIALIVIEREDADSLTASDISQKMGISKKNVSRLLDQLENGGLIKRQEHASDGRAHIVKLSKKGSSTLAKILPGYYEIINTSLSPLSKGDTKDLASILSKVLAG